MGTSVKSSTRTIESGSYPLSKTGISRRRFLPTDGGTGISRSSKLHPIPPYSQSKHTERPHVPWRGQCFPRHAPPFGLLPFWKTQPLCGREGSETKKSALNVNNRTIRSCYDGQYRVDDELVRQNSQMDDGCPRREMRGKPHRSNFR